MVKATIRYLDERFRGGKLGLPRISDKHTRHKNTVVKDVRVRDGRPLLDRWDLEGSGFTMCKHTTKVTDFKSIEGARQFRTEAIALVKTLTGAEHGEIFFPHLLFSDIFVVRSNCYRAHGANRNSHFVQ
jgi:hypothetical protein